MLEGVSAAWALLTARQTGAIAAKEGRRPPDDGPGNRTKGRGRGGLFAAAVALVASSSLFSAPALAQSQGAAQDRTNCSNFATNSGGTRSLTVVAGQTGQVSIFTGNATGGTNGGTSHTICNWSLTITSPPTQGSAGGSSYVGGGMTASYTANSNANGIDQFQARLTSGYSGGSGFVTVNVIVQGNPAPTVNDVSASTGHNQAVSIPSSTGGSVSSLNVGSAANGTVGVAGFNLVYTPNAGFYGQDQFAYSANGPGGRSADATARVTVAPPSPPTASNGSVNASYNTTTGAFRVNVGGTWNYEYNNVEIVSGPSRGTLTGAGYEWFTYTPNNGWIGADSFTYRVTGPGGASNVATMTVTTSPPPAPTAGNTTMTASYNGGEVSRAMPISGVATEAQGVTPPSNGTYGFFGTTAYYTPRAGFYGSDSFTYRAVGPGGNSAPATVSVTVTPPAAPSVASRSVSTAYNTSVSAPSGVSGVYSSLGITAFPANGNASIVGTDIVYAPSAGFIGTNTISGDPRFERPRLSSRPRHTSGLIRRLAGLAFELTPQIFAVLAFGAGALMLASAVTPEFDSRLRQLTGVVSPILIDLSHFVGSIAGFLLLLLSAGLWRRRRGAYWAALLVLAVGAVFSVLKGLDWEQATDLLVVAALLAPCRTAFNRRSRLSEPLRPSWLLLLTAVVAAMLWLGFFAYRDVAYNDELWWRFLSDRQASGFLRAGLVLAILTLVVAGRSLLSSPGAHSHGPASKADIDRALQALQTADTATPEAWLAMLGDKALMFSPSGSSFLAYRVRGRRWIAMGEPAGLKSERLELLWSFAEMADSYGGAAVFYSVSEEVLGDLATMGLAVRKVGETAVIDAHRFSIEGKGKQNLRTAINRAEREGSSFEVLPPGSAAAIADELREISDAWLAMHEGSEKSFSLGRFDVDYLDLTPLAVVKEGGRVVAFANLLTSPDEAAVDLMRHRPDAPHGVMDYLFIRCAQWAKAEGLASFDLGMAPLAGLEDRRIAPVFARVGALVFEEGGALYGFQGLRSYKAKFGPDWRSRFIAAPVSTPLPLALLDVALLTSGGWLGMLGLKKA